MVSSIINRAALLKERITITKVDGLTDAMKHVVFHTPYIYFILGFSLILGLYIYYVSRKYGKREALKEDHTDINTHTGDRDVLDLEQMFQQYNIIPDAGAISKSVKPTAILLKKIGIYHRMNFNVQQAYSL